METLNLDYTPSGCQKACLSTLTREPNQRREVASKNATEKRNLLRILSGKTTSSPGMTNRLFNGLFMTQMLILMLFRSEWREKRVVSPFKLERIWL